LEQLRAELAASPSPPIQHPSLELEPLRANLQTLAAEFDAYRNEQSRLEAEVERYRPQAGEHQAALSENQQPVAILQADLDEARTAAASQPEPTPELDALRVKSQAQLPDAELRHQRMAAELA
jgi:predicted  nucleic acid-binding Zn-ribbon protein